MISYPHSVEKLMVVLFKDFLITRAKVTIISVYHRANDNSKELEKTIVLGNFYNKTSVKYKKKICGQNDIVISSKLWHSFSTSILSCP